MRCVVVVSFVVPFVLCSRWMWLFDAKELKVVKLETSLKLKELIIFMYFSLVILIYPMSDIYFIDPDQMKMTNLNKTFLRSDERADEA